MLTTDYNTIQRIIKKTFTNYIPKARNTDKVLNSYALSKLNQEDVSNLIRSVISNKIEADI